jgi:hypothetical protein
MLNRKLRNIHPIGVYSPEVITFGVPFEGWGADTAAVGLPRLVEGKYDM